MGEVDRQRLSAVRTLEGLGYTYRDGEGWKPPPARDQWIEADVLYNLLTIRADHLADRSQWSREATEHRTITRALWAYKSKRWPDGEDPGGKG
jgi:hypothetical protein